VWGRTWASDCRSLPLTRVIYSTVFRSLTSEYHNRRCHHHHHDEFDDVISALRLICPSHSEHRQTQISLVITVRRRRAVKFDNMQTCMKRNHKNACNAVCKSGLLLLVINDYVVNINLQNKTITSETETLGFVFEMRQISTRPRSFKIDLQTVNWYHLVISRCIILPHSVKHFMRQAEFLLSTAYDHSLSTLHLSILLYTTSCIHWLRAGFTNVT